MRPTEFSDTLDLSFDQTELPQGDRPEPPLIVGTAIAGSADTMALDPTRIDFDPESAPPRRSGWRGPVGSMLLHLLPLLALIGWLRPPLDVPPLIPIQLVIEQPPPPPPPAQAKPQAAPPPGLRASDDFGDVGTSKAAKDSDQDTPKHGEPAPPATQTATAAPEPSPSPAEPAQGGAAAEPASPDPPLELGQAAIIVPALPQPPPEPQQAAPAPAPSPPPRPIPPKQMAAVRPPKMEGLMLPLPFDSDSPRNASASARYPGPNATRDEYCVYALNLTMRHIDLLPLTFLGARRGDATVTIHLREDGTIVSAMVARSSGYLDIDERVAQMVRAVGRFPPLPVWLPGPSADFTFHLHFPNPAEH